MKKIYKVLIIIGSVLVVLIVGGVIAFSVIDKNLEALKGMEIADIDLSEVEDGVYTGSYTCFPVSAEVEVKVRSHSVTDIALIKHNHGQGNAAETIPGTVIEAQSLKVDAVSGATYSSKVILKAIENALAGG